MLDKLKGIEERYEQLGNEFLEVGSNYQRAAEINKERVDLEPIVEKAREYRQAMKSLEEARTMLEIRKRCGTGRIGRSRYRRVESEDRSP